MEPGGLKHSFGAIWIVQFCIDLEQNPNLDPFTITIKSTTALFSFIEEFLANTRVDHEDNRVNNTTHNILHLVII